ncbi:ABC transporter permease (plasmid) [Bacillus sp. F19]|nr:ABC transporter permease [Bacillus sp. F19]
MSSSAPKLTKSANNFIPQQNSELEATKSKSYWALVGKRLITNKSAVIGAIILLFFVTVSLLAPLIAQYPIDVMEIEKRFLPPGGEHLLGTDEFGRDIFSRMLYGGRVSLMVGLVAVLIAGMIGVILGIISGYYRRIDIYIMQFMDILLAFPSLLLAIAIIAVLGVGLTNAMIAVAISVVPSYVRVVRGTVLSIREKEYIEAVRALGVSDLKIIVKHVFPNVLSPIIVLSSLQFGTSILVAAALSFLGLGAQPPTPEWGAMAYVGKSFLGQAWWMSLFPGLAIMLVVLGFNLLGDGLRDALDPRQK